MSNQLVKSECINNKDLMIVSLLEYICDDNNELFELVCDNLYKNNIIDDTYIKYPINKKYMHQFLTNIIKDISINDKLELKTNLDKTLHSRYDSDFIEFKILGSGGFGSVYEVYNKLDDNKYAIKKVPLLEINSIKSLNEVRNLSKLEHKNIIRYYTTWIELGENLSELLDDESNDKIIDNNKKIIPILYIQMELCDMSLRDYLDKRNYSGDKIDIIKEKEKFIEILDGVKYIHDQNMIHGDLNPSNIFIKNGHIKIGDFGLSKKLDNCDSVKHYNYGNVLYLSPEQLSNNLISQKADIYSLGLIYYELITIFSTQIERIKMLNSIKQNEKLNILSKDPVKRPNIDEIINYI